MRAAATPNPTRAGSRNPSGVSWETFFTFGAATVYGEDTIEDERAAYSTSGISKSFAVKNSTRPVATAAGFLPGKSWLAHGINTVSIFGIHCWSRSAPSKNTGNVLLPRIDSTGCACQDDVRGRSFVSR